ncbi:MAG: type II 3-dehydroquinate dehydratase [Alphaproteobacteria bacterium]
MPAKILLVNGPNLNKLGSREPDIYGHITLEEILHQSIEQAHTLGMELECFQSNHEGELIDAIQHAQGRFAGLIINAGAFTHTSVAIMDALLTLSIPVIEVHLSNPARREEFRHISYVSKAATGCISGFGAQSYRLALEAMAGVVKVS